MEYCEGGSLANIGPRSKSSLSQMAMDLAQSLYSLHQDFKIVHRDIKPENILIRIDENGEEKAVFVDFGLGRFSRAGKPLMEKGLLGTYSYMAPDFENRAEEYSPDLWALGATIYTMFSYRNELPYLANPMPIVPCNYQPKYPGTRFPLKIRKLISILLQPHATGRRLKFESLLKKTLVK